MRPRAVAVPAHAIGWDRGHPVYPVGVYWAIARQIIASMERQGDPGQPCSTECRYPRGHKDNGHEAED